ncbi:MAG: cation:dicarboxylase symporter family transporter [Acidobacteriota bacterium]
MSLSKQILIGLLLGVATGLFLGEMVSPLRTVAEIFIQLLQMTVLPYVTVSLISGLGSLTLRQARMMLTRVGGLLLLLWALTFVMVFLMPWAFPDWESASFFSTSLVETREPLDFVGLYIPSNPFHSLANNVVPAVVLFSVFLGLALIRVENKDLLIGWLGVAAKAINEVTHFIVRLTPIGLFAIGAHIAGTLRVEELERVQVYLILYGASALLLMLWILPGLVSALTPVPYKELLGLSRDALITAFMTGNLFVVLPILSQTGKDLIRRHIPDHPDAVALPDVIVPASFNFPHAGKILTLSFILFAGWFSDVSLSLPDKVRLFFTGTLSFFGSVNVAAPYLLDLFRIPIDTFQLFLATSVVNARFGSGIAAMHTLALAVLGASALSGALHFQRRKVVRFATITLALLLVVFGGFRFFFGRVLAGDYTKDKLLLGMGPLHKSVPEVIHRDGFRPLPDADRQSSLLDRIRARGVLRVGYFPAALPYAFFNSRGELVGFDIDMAQLLAKDLGTSLEFVALEPAGAMDALRAGECDIIMTGFALTPERAAEAAFCDSHMRENTAFVVFDHRRDDFLTWDSVHSIEHLRLAVPDLPYYVAKMREELPDAELIPVRSIEEFMKEGSDAADALVLSAERGSAWCLLYPNYSVVVPRPSAGSIPLAYPISDTDPVFINFLNAWLELKKGDGTIQSLYDHWILGKDAQSGGPRWCVIRDVLHWTD